MAKHFVSGIRLAIWGQEHHANSRRRSAEEGENGDGCKFLSKQRTDDKRSGTVRGVSRTRGAAELL
jgi:hypothetical protein